jgi:hypothetical protein
MCTVGVISFLAIALGASAARACGGCLDVGMVARAWWAPSVGALVKLLLLEVLVTGVVLRALERAPTVSRAGATALAFVLGFVLSIVSGGSATGLVIGMGLVLVPMFVRSLRRELAGARIAVALRTLGVLVPAFVIVWGARPASVPTDVLVRRVDRVREARAADGWIVAELRGRVGATADLERVARDERAPDEERARALKVLGVVDGEARRTALCAAIRPPATTPPAEEAEPPRDRVSRICNDTVTFDH